MKANNKLVKKTQSGFSLIEVLIFVSILGIFFVYAAAAVTISIRNSKINEHKIIATHYADEVLAWVLAKREIDWNAFSQRASTNPVYCFNQTPIDDPSLNDPDSGWILGPCADYTGLNPPIYKREVSLSQLDNTGLRVSVAITIEWQELGKTYTVRSNAVFSLWE